MIRHITGLIILGLVVYVAFTMPLCIGVPCVETMRDTITAWRGEDGEKGVERGVEETPLPHTATVEDDRPTVRTTTAPAAKESTPGALRVIKDAITKESGLSSTGIIVATNLERVTLGIAPLKENSALRAAAEAKVADLFARQYFEHESPTGEGPSDLARTAGYAYILVGENLALGNFENDQAVVTAWMNSPGHRANILKAGYQEIGVAARKGTYEGRAVWIAVQEFGTPRAACPNTSTELSLQIDTNNAKLDAVEAELRERKQSIDATSPHDPSYNAQVDAYNALVAEYNTLLRTTRALVDDYNAQVRTFNTCLAQYTEQLTFSPSVGSILR